MYFILDIKGITVKNVIIIKNHKINFLINKNKIIIMSPNPILSISK